MTDPQKNATNDAAKAEPKDNVTVTQHRIMLNGRDLAYTVTCGTVVLKEESEKDGAAEADKPRASVFFIAYTLNGVSDVAKRPITFSFNGGPGSSSVWLHLGVLGPKRVVLDDEGNAPPPPYRLEPNHASLLPVSDLVFIDPAGTGFSRMLAGEKTDEFHEYKRDLESVGEFIRLYTSRNARWASPKYLAGESYGTTRAAGLASHLQDRYGLYLNGLMLISVALDFQTLRFDTGNDMAPLLFLPTYAATAWYHKCLPADLQAKPLADVLVEVERFAETEYLAALFKGDALTAGEQTALAQKLSRYTGLSEDYVKATRLRVHIHRFCKELLRKEGRTVGRLDSRFKGFDRDSAGEQMEYDPSHANLYGAYAATLNQYVRSELKFESDSPYEVLKSLYLKWGWKDFANRYANVAEPLRRSMNINPHMRVFVGNGMFDLATPHFASRYTFNHLAIDPSLRGNIVVKDYPAGHMMYIHKPSLDSLGRDLQEFVRV